MIYEFNPPLQAVGKPSGSVVDGDKFIVLAVNDDFQFTCVYNDGSNKGKLRDLHGSLLTFILENFELRATQIRRNEKLAILAFLPSEKVIAVYREGDSAGTAGVFGYAEILMDDFYWPEIREKLDYGDHPQDV